MKLLRHPVFFVVAAVAGVAFVVFLGIANVSKQTPRLSGYLTEHREHARHLIRRFQEIGETTGRFPKDLGEVRAGDPDAAFVEWLKSSAANIAIPMAGEEYTMRSTDILFVWTHPRHGKKVGILVSGAATPMN